MIYTVTIFQPLQPGQSRGAPTCMLDLDSDIVSLVFTTANPGGYGSLEVGLRRSYDGAYVGLPQPVDIVPFAHIELTAGSRHLFEGRVVGLDKSAGGHASGIVAQGYGICGLTDDYVESYDQTRRSSGVLLREIMGERAPLVRVGVQYIDPGVMHAKAEFHGMSPSEVLHQISREGGGATAGIGGHSGIESGVWDWLVYEDRIARFTPRIPPAGTAADPYAYLVPFDGRLAWHEDYEGLYGQVGVRYSDLDAGGPPVLGTRYTDPTYQQRYGIQRAEAVNAGQLRPSAAASYGQTRLAGRAVASYAMALIREGGAGLETPGGTDVAPWLVRSGEWVKAGDQVPLPILHTRYDAMSGTLEAEAGAPLPAVLAHSAQSQRQVSGGHIGPSSVVYHGHGTQPARTRAITAHLVRGTNPSTGSRA